MIDNSPLEQFLVEQGSHGIQQEPGGFSISPDKAFDKLARFSLPRSSAWLGKMVQAAVSWDCHKIVLEASRRKLTLSFQLSSDQVPTPEETVSQLFRPLVARETALGAFCVGLRALSEQAGLSFRLEHRKAGSLLGAIVCGSKAKLGAVAAQPCDGLVLGAALPTLGSLGRHLGSELEQEFRHSCFTSPVPIEFRGVRLDGNLGYLYSNEERFTPLTLFGLELGQSPPLGVFQRTKTHFFPWERAWHPELFHAVPEGDDRVSTFATLGLLRCQKTSRFRSGRNCQLSWVDRGVVVFQRELSVSTEVLAGQIFLNAEGLVKDLSDFHLVNNREYRARLGEALENLAREMDKADPVKKRLVEENEAYTGGQPFHTPKHSSDPTLVALKRDWVELTGALRDAMPSISPFQ